MTPRESMEHQHADPPSDHAAHTAPAEPHPIRMNHWQRWMAWSGSFFVLSLILHIVIIGGAAMLVVQVVQGRKEKLKFTPPPPSAAGPSEHKVKPSKKTAAAAPAITKRITSSAANASIALPAMDMSSSTGPDVMASVMSGMGASGLGAGAAGGAGMASMPLSGLTAFGFKGKGGGFKGTFYDLKQTSDKRPTGIKEDDDQSINVPGLNVSVAEKLVAELNLVYEWQSRYANGWKTHCTVSNIKHLEVLDEFFGKGWDTAVLDRYYKSKDSVIAPYIYIPNMKASNAPAAFNLQNEVKPAHWVIHYKGTVVAPKSGSYRFIGAADDFIAVRMKTENGWENVFLSAWPAFIPIFKSAPNLKNLGAMIDTAFVMESTGSGYPGKWFQVDAGKSYPIEAVVCEIPGGNFNASLLIEERDASSSYAKQKNNPKAKVYPVFQVLPLKDGTFPQGSASAPEVAAPNTVIFKAK